MTSSTGRAPVGQLIEQFTPPQRQELSGSLSGASSFEMVPHEEERASIPSSRVSSRSQSPAPMRRSRSASPALDSITYPASTPPLNSQSVSNAAQSALNHIHQPAQSSTSSPSQPGAERLSPERRASGGRWQMYDSSFRSVSASPVTTRSSSFSRRHSDGSFTEERKGLPDHVSFGSGNRSPALSGGHPPFLEDTYSNPSEGASNPNYWIEPPHLTLAPEVQLAMGEDQDRGLDQMSLRRQIPFEQKYLSVIKWLAFVAIKCFAILFLYIKMPLSSEIFLTATVAASALLWATRAELARNFDSSFNISHDYLMESYKFLVVVNIFIGLRFLFSNLFTNSPVVCLLLTTFSLVRSYCFYKDWGEINRALQQAAVALPV